MSAQEEPFWGVRKEKLFVRPRQREHIELIEIELRHSGDTPGLLREDSRGMRRFALLKKSEARKVAVRLAELAGFEKVLNTLVMLDED